MQTLLENDLHGESIRRYDKSMRVLFRRLAEMQRKAEKELLAEKVGRRVERARDSFLRDFPNTARREQALPMLDEIRNVLDNTPEADAIRIELQRIRRDFKFDGDLTEPIADYNAFVAALQRISYAGLLGVSDAAGGTRRPSAAAEKVATAGEVKNKGTEGKPEAPKTAVFDGPDNVADSKSAQA